MGDVDRMTTTFALPLWANGTSRRDMVRHPGGFTTYNGGLPAVDDYAHKVDLPSTDVSNGIYLIEAIEPLDLLALSFVLTDAASKTATARLWGMRGIQKPAEIGKEPKVELLGVHLLDLSITAGSGTPEAGSEVFPESNSFFASAIVATVDNTPSPGFRNIGASPSPVVGFFDGTGFPYYVLALNRGSAASVLPVVFQF